MQSSRKLSKMRGESWKFRCHQPCLARSGEESTRKPVALLAHARQNTHASLKADESVRKRVGGTVHKDHEDHNAEKGINSLSHYNLVHEFILMRQAMKKYQLRKLQWKKNGKILYNNGMAADESQKQKEVIDEGRVVLRGDIVKDDSGSYTAFTEEGSSASQMTAATVMDVNAKLPGCAVQAADAVSAYTHVKMEDAPTLLENSPVRMSRYLDTSTTTQVAKIMVRHVRAESVR